MSDDLVKRLREPCLERGLDELWIDAQRKEAADRIEELEAKLAKAFVALSDLADCVDLGCFCSEMEQATVMDKARATLTELTGGKNE